MCAAERKRNGRRLRFIFWGLLVLAGLGVWILFLGGYQADRAWRAFLVNFLFFTSLAGGLVTWSAIVLASSGTWPRQLERLTMAGAGFAIPSVLALLALWIGSSQWAPWHGKSFHQGLWLSNSVLFARDLTLLVFFWIMVLWYRARRRRGEGKSLAAWLVFVYCIVWSLLGFDLVMALQPEWVSSLFGGYFFISGLYIAVAAWAFMASIWPTTHVGGLHDIGKLVFAFAILTTYMMYAQLLPIYYENLPHETIFVLPRLSFPWKIVSFVLLGLVYLGPLALLLMIRAKRSRWWLGTVAFLLLVGLWVERWWLVMPAFMPWPRFGWVDGSITAAFVGLAGICLEWGYLRGEISGAGGEE